MRRRTRVSLRLRLFEDFECPGRFAGSYCSVAEANFSLLNASCRPEAHFALCIARSNPDSLTKNENMQTQDTVIEIRNLSKVYRDFWGRKKVQAVKSLSLDVKRGEVFGLLGPNGSGKTTTIKMLLGLLFPTSGEIKILGKKASDVEKNERIGYLPEESYLYRFLNADETMDFYGRLFKISATERVQRADELIKMVGLDSARRRQLKEYSKGMTRRIGLAQALINNPDLVILDEPTSGLDPIGTREMKDLILKLKDEGKTVVLCSHQLADVQDVSDRIAVLFQGELKVLGEVDQLLELREETEIRTGNLSDEAIAEVRQVLEKHGMKDSLIQKPRADLEELFLKTVRESGERPGRRFTAEEMAATQPAAATAESVNDSAGS